MVNDFRPWRAALRDTRTETGKSAIEYVVRDTFKGPIGKNWSTYNTIGPGNYRSGVFFGKQGIKLTVFPGDHTPVDQDRLTERAELTELDPLRLPAGTAARYSLEFLVPPDYVDRDERMVVAQWKNVTKSIESPPFAWRFRSGKLFFTVQKNGDERIISPPISLEKGKWYALDAELHLDSTHQGDCRAYVDGKEAFSYSGHVGADHDPTDLVFKFGPYRDTTSFPDSLYFSNYARRVLSSEV